MWLAERLPNKWASIYMDNLFNLQKLFSALYIAEALAQGLDCTLLFVLLLRLDLDRHSNLCIMRNTAYY